MRRRQSVLPGIDGVTIPDFGWERTRATDEIVEWRESGGEVSLNYFPHPPDLTRPVGDDKALWRRFAKSSDDSSAVMEARWIDLDGVSAVEVMMKARVSETRMTYAASIAIPFRDFSWVVWMQFVDLEGTGVREALAFDAHLAKHGVDGRDAWGPDEVGVRVLPSDDPRWDEFVPRHPLSRLRAMKATIKDTIIVSAAARDQPAYR